MNISLIFGNSCITSVRACERSLFVTDLEMRLVVSSRPISSTISCLSIACRPLQFGPSMARLTESTSFSEAVWQCNRCTTEMAHSSGELLLHLDVVTQIWESLDKAELFLFPKAKSTYWWLWLSPAGLNSMLGKDAWGSFLS